MTDFVFAEPQWVHLLWVVFACAAALVWLERRRGDALDRFVSTAMQGRLARAPSPMQRIGRVALLALTGVFLCLALMRPQWGAAVVESRRAGAEIMIALDVSRSMLAEDVAPNRLERAKVEIQDLLELLEGDQVGLIAFAGRASVLAPLTPDFGFLRLALEDASADSVRRGGTRLEEPIRKAIAGFGDTSDVSRSILLITDGEDHDSFPMEAARAAAERGIRILAIGFGAEAGSEIPITDAKTGARTVVRDADGEVVRTRLDGDLLREMALATSGAYVPAGTGQLDLESIYLRHIAPLTRGRLDGASRTVRNDAFQWAVLLALLALVGAVSSTARVGPPRASSPASSRTAAAGLMVLPVLGLPVSTAVLLAALAAGPVLAQGLAQSGGQSGAQTGGKVDGTGTSGVAARDPATSTTAPLSGTASAAKEGVEAPKSAGSGSAANGAAAGATGADGTGTSRADVDPAPADPRTAYNQGLKLLQAGNADAARFLDAARTGAGIDGEVRFRATYNLGWADVNAADSLIEDEPQQALEHLYRAAGWFRDAVGLRPGDEDARYNLEIVLRRALELADSLAAGRENDLRAALEALIEGQRGFLSELRKGVALQQAEAARSGSPAVPGPALRRQFRALASAELTVLAEAEAVSEQAARELEQLRSPATASAPGGAEPDAAEQALRAARLEAMVGHLHQARERMGQARSRMRRVQGERAYRRAAAALAALHQARDQLLEPVARLDALLADGTELARLTALKSLFGQQSRGAGPLLTNDSDRGSQAQPATPSTDSAQEQERQQEQISAPNRVMASAGSAEAAPRWLSLRYLTQTQSSIEARATELQTELEAGLQAAAEASASDGGSALPPTVPPAAPQGSGAPPDTNADANVAAQAQRLMRVLEKATPLVASASDHFAQAAGAIKGERLDAAVGAQGEALEALAEAREMFLDLRGLVELVYREERQVETLLEVTGAAGTADHPDPLARKPDDSAITKGAGAEREGAGTADGSGANQWALATALHQRNLERALRLSEMFSDAMTEQDSAAAGGSGAGDAGSLPKASAALDSEAGPGAGRDRLEQGYNLLGSAVEQMYLAREGFAAASQTPSASAPADTATDGAGSSPLAEVEASLVHLEALRRLFFDLLEHLKDTAMRHQTLADETEALAALTDQAGSANTAPPVPAPVPVPGAGPVADRAGPLGSRQVALATLAGQLGEALREQAAAPPTDPQTNPPGAGSAPAPGGSAPAPGGSAPAPGGSAPAPGGSAPAPGGSAPPPAVPADAAVQAEAAERMGAAADLVTEAGGRMSAAATTLQTPQPVLDSARSAQNEAASKLAEAIALLEQGSDQDQQEQDQGSDQSQAGNQQQEQPQPEERTPSDLSQLLQGVRDREARRREQQADRAARGAGYESVEKDW